MTSLNKIKEKILLRYKRELGKILRAKYKRKAYNIAKNKKIYLNTKYDIKKQFLKIESEIYHTYQPLLEEELDIKLEEFKQSPKFQTAIDNEINLSKRKLSYKILKRYQEFNININKKFLLELYKEINSNKDEPTIELDEIKYILLSICYKIIDLLKLGYKIKIGTILTIWINKRDVRVNLPNVKERIIPNRLIPTIKLGNSFNHNLFLEVNKDNKAILNYYKAKTERFLSLFDGEKK